MTDDNKKWYQVEGFATVLFGFNVRASSEEEAERLFVESDVAYHELESEVLNFDFREVTECKESDVTHDLTRRLTRGKSSELAEEPSL
jgi:hypothetical protein